MADEIRIARVGRWSYSLSYHPDGSWCGFEGPTVLGRRRAERIARRELRRLGRRKPNHVATISAEAG